MMTIDMPFIVIRDTAFPLGLEGLREHRDMAVGNG